MMALLDLSRRLCNINCMAPYVSERLLCMNCKVPVSCGLVNQRTRDQGFGQQLHQNWKLLLRWKARAWGLGAGQRREERTASRNANLTDNQDPPTICKAKSVASMIRCSEEEA